jgi:hypothetical protein
LPGLDGERNNHLLEAKAGRLIAELGQKKAVAIAVKNVSGRRRWSKLREWLNPASFSIPQSIGA